MTAAVVSPRTEAEPMAFTSWEFIRGAVTAWWLFLPILAVLHLFLGLGSLIVVVNALPWSLGALIVFSPAAWLLGRMLRRTARVGIHLLAFAAIGAAIGAATTGVAVAVNEYDGIDTAPLSALHITAATIAVALGWRSTARRALRTEGGAG